MFRKCVKTELWKALHNPMLYFALMIGVMIVLMDAEDKMALIKTFDQRIAPHLAADSTWLSLDHVGYSLFAHTMLYGPGNYPGLLFAFIWPVMAAMPYGWSYCQERKNGLFNQIASRCGAKKYYLSKYVAVFVSGGLAISMTVLLDLLVNAMILPYSELSPVLGVSAIISTGFLPELFYSCAWLHGLIWCGVTFLLGGAAACLCFLVGNWIRLQVVVILVPFALLSVFNELYDFICIQVTGIKTVELSPLSLIRAAPATPASEWVIFSVLGAMTVLSLSVGYWQVVKHELA